MSKKSKTYRISIISIFIAMEIIFSRFLSIQTWNLKIGFSFIPIVISAILFGPYISGLIACIADLIGAILFPVGAYFPGFTITALLTGFIFGIFLKSKQSIPRIIFSVIISQIFLSLFLNTYWMSILYHNPYWPLFSTRIYQSIVLTIVQIVTIIILNKKLIPILKLKIS